MNGGRSQGSAIVGADVPNAPWEDRPAGCDDVVWRSAANPIIRRNALPQSNSIFNGAAVPFEAGFAGVFRVDDRRYKHRLHVGRSDDGIRWRLEAEPLTFVNEVGMPPAGGGYDPRITRLDDRYFLTWCNGYHGPSVGIAWTEDFGEFRRLENALPPHNRNGVLFPRRIGGKYALLHRPSAPGHFAHGDIFYSESPDLCHWGRHRHVMSPVPGWNDTKIGAGPPPLETAEGWLLLYHGVQTTCNGSIYRMGGAILDPQEPWRVRCRSAPYLLGPQTPYECAGDVPNVVFPCGLIADAATGRLAIYYGAADTCIALAFARAGELIEYIKANSEPQA